MFPFLANANNINIAKCKKCLGTIRMQNTPNQKLSQFNLCETCALDTKLYSKTFCVKKLGIQQKHLNNLETQANTGNKTYYYGPDIEHILSSEFTSIEANKHRTVTMQNKKESNKEKRKNELMEALEANKLSYKKFGDCYTWVNYGFPDLQTVISNELEKTTQQTQRAISLIDQLAIYNKDIAKITKFLTPNNIDYIRYIYDNSPDALNNLVGQAQLTQTQTQTQTQ